MLPSHRGFCGPTLRAVNLSIGSLWQIRVTLDVVPNRQIGIVYFYDENFTVKAEYIYCLL